ncbi:thiamine pyrophosphate-binding protein [Halobacillus salinarum]|uniref:Thiamine pyrophosphate-binding protein n=1 Tax=Halobacillus salinarum TaxID=2932257 RepID=A0ABY4EEL7_9BACI|nr:thiamine pyrophosphate-dependent enzyme [Halobacillus salinarum]UOQ42907.1 thiamine pyrophosphate-binding protein [Halobacillus salinarum]
MSTGSLYLSGAKALVECLKLEKISHVFCVPGESYLPVMDAIYDEPSIQLISSRHEGGASFMAEGYAKAARLPGVVMATRGVGASNLAIGVHTAFQDSTPMVVFLGQVHSAFRGREGFQEVELDRFFSHLAKWTVEIHDVERIPELVQRAFRTAITGRPGPVVVSLPEDVLAKRAIMHFSEPLQRPSPKPCTQEIKAMEALLRTAKRPLIIAGGGIKHSQGEEELLQFSSKFQIPVMAAFRRHDVFPNHHPLYCGHLGLGVSAKVLSLVQSADTIIAIGTRLSEVTTQDYSIITKDKKLVHIDIDHAVVGKVFAPDLGIVADAAEALRALNGLLFTPKWSDWRTECRKAYEDSIAEPDGDRPLNHQIISILNKSLPARSILTNDAGNFAGWLHTYYQFNEKNSYIGPTSGAMGYGMPAALGAKLARPEATVISLSGDGGFMMTIQEMETAVRYNIPVISLIFNNSMYGTIRMHQEIHFPNKPIGTDLGLVPFAKIAENFGATGYLVKNSEEFEQALSKALLNHKPAVIEVECDPEQISVSSTIKQIRNRVPKN